MRTDYLKTGIKETDQYLTFPFSPTNPILIIGILKGNKGIYRDEVQSKSEFKHVIEEAKTKCKRGSIQLIGVWVGKWRTDLFQLNNDFYIEKMSK